MEFRETTVKNWKKLFEIYEGFEPKTQWVFRGLSNKGYPLKTTLERAAKRFGLNANKLSEMESTMIRHFKRQAHRYLENLPKDDDTIEWLALMQHYGSPTRLLDWTYSFFVAVFFAVEQSETNRPCAVWAIDMDWVIETAEQLFDEHAFGILRKKDSRLKSENFFNLVFNSQPPVALVYSLNPERLNERLIVQQGLFLAPADISKSFEKNLDAICKIDPNAKSHIRKITIDAAVSAKCEILRHLHRMNINRASLFPGLGGFAQSLTTYLANPSLMGKNR